MTRSSPGWVVYERMIAQLMANQVSTDLCVTANAHVMGRISGRSRQIDALIDTRHDTDNSRRIIVDAKRRKRKIDVTDVEAFRGLMDDVGATHGYLICPTGHTKAAEKRAQMAVTICLVALDHIPNFDPMQWPQCKNTACKQGRVFWDGYPELSPVMLHGTQRIRVPFVHSVGKCDRCGRFHVECHRCGDILSLPEDREDDFGHSCRCRPPWFWLASIEEDEEGRRSGELHVVPMNRPDQPVTFDRRPYD